MQIRPDGTQRLSISRVESFGETFLGGVDLPGPIVAGQALTVRMQTTGSSPTTLKVKAWPTGTPEPSDWTVERTDTTPALATIDGIGIRGYLSSNATNTPITTRLDNLTATRP